MSNSSGALGSWVRTKKVILLLLLVIALGSFLRIYGLGTESIWVDEVHSINVSGQNLATAITEAASGQQAPLYFIILHPWMGLFGNSEVAVRSLSVIFGVISILLIYLTGSALFNRKVGLISSFLSAISFFHIYYSQEARPYTLLLLLSLLSFLLFIQILKQNKKWYYPCYLIANILLVYTHVFGLFIVAAQLLFLLLFWTTYKPQRLKLLSLQIATAVAGLPLVFLLSPVAKSMIEQGFWIPEPSFRSIAITFNNFAGQQILLILVFFCLVVVAPLAISRTGAKWVLRKPLQSLKGMGWNIRLEAIEEFLLLAIWLLLPIVLAFVISKIFPIYVDRYLIGTTPALYLLVAKGLSNLKLRRIIYPVILIIALLALPGLTNYYTEYDKEQWREVAQHVELNSQENDVLLFCAYYVQSPFDYYYKGGLDEFGIDRYEEDIEDIAALVNNAISGKQRLWLILSHFNLDPPAVPPVETYLRDRYPGDALVMEKDFVKVRVILFDLKEPDTGQ